MSADSTPTGDVARMEELVKAMNNSNEVLMRWAEQPASRRHVADVFLEGAVAKMREGITSLSAEMKKMNEDLLQRAVEIQEREAALEEEKKAITRCQVAIEEREKFQSELQRKLESRFEDFYREQANHNARAQLQAMADQFTTRATAQSPPSVAGNNEEKIAPPSASEPPSPKSEGADPSLQAATPSTDAD